MERIDTRGDAGRKALLAAHPADEDITKEAKAEIAPYNTLGGQIDWTGLTGTLDGVIVFQQSNHDIPTSNQWDNMGLSHTLDTASGSITLADVNFTGRRMRAVYTKNGISGGTFNVELIAKK